MRSHRSRARGATLVEYSLILVAVVLLAAGSWKLLGGKVGTRSGAAGNVVAEEGSEKGSGGGKGGESAAGGAKSGGDKGSVGAKVSVGGVGGAAGEQGNSVKAASTRDTSSESNGPLASITRDSGGNADVSESFTPKRWMGIGLLAAGVIAIGYVVTSLRRTKKAADAAGGGKDRSNLPRRRSKR